MSEAAPPATAALAAHPAGNTVHVVVTRVGDEALGFRLEKVSEIIRIPTLAYMPLAPKSLLGLANLRGAVLPVVQPFDACSVSPRHRSMTMPVSSCSTAVLLWGFAVDGVERFWKFRRIGSPWTVRAPAVSIRIFCTAS